MGLHNRKLAHVKHQAQLYVYSALFLSRLVSQIPEGISVMSVGNHSFCMIVRHLYDSVVESFGVSGSVPHSAQLPSYIKVGFSAAVRPHSDSASMT